MHVILGGTGQVGSATARALLERGEPVTIVTRDPNHGSDLEAAGSRIAVADVRDVARLREVFRTGTRAFLLNPSAAPTRDTDAEERANVAAIVEVLDGSGLEKVVAASTYGARPGERCGDLTVLHEFERRLKAQSIPAAINRGAYYMSNWGGMLDAVRGSYTLPSFLPADMALPMVAPEDLGEAARASPAGACERHRPALRRGARALHAARRGRRFLRSAPSDSRSRGDPSRSVGSDFR
jgi:uncharacterized protein YbjT (DUF2867 family)